MAARSGILGLGSRLYPGNMQRIFNKDLTRFMQSLSRERQNRASKRKALLAGCCEVRQMSKSNFKNNVDDILLQRLLKYDDYIDVSIILANFDSLV